MHALRTFFAAVAALSLLAGCDGSAGPPEGGGGTLTASGGSGGGDTGGAGGGGAGGAGGGIPWASGTASFAPAWQAHIGCAGTIWSRLGPVFLDEDEDVWVGGTIDGACSLFGADTVEAGTTSVVAAKLDGIDGSPAWTTHIALGDALFGFQAVGYANGLLIAGGFDEPISLDGTTELEPFPFFDHSPAFTTFVAKLGDAGAVDWSRALAVESVGTTFAVDTDGEIAAFSGTHTADFGGGALEVPLSANAFARLDAVGNHVWSQVIGASFPSLLFADHIALDETGRVVVVATLRGAMAFGEETLVSPDTLSPIVLLFDAAGAPLWSHVFLASEDWCNLRAHPLSDGSIVLAGVCSGTLAAGPQTLGRAGQTSGVVIRLDANGSIAWARDVGGHGVERVLITEGSAGGILVGGDFTGEIDLGDGELPSAGGRDLYLAELDVAGATQWSQRMGDEWDQTLEAIARTANGDIVVSSGVRLEPYPYAEGSDAYPAGLFTVARLSMKRSGGDRRAHQAGGRPASVCVGVGDQRRDPHVGRGGPRASLLGALRRCEGHPRRRAAGEGLLR